MTVPYGAWMGSRIHDSFWAPHDLLVDILARAVRAQGGDVQTVLGR